MVERNLDVYINYAVRGLEGVTKEITNSMRLIEIATRRAGTNVGRALGGMAREQQLLAKGAPPEVAKKIGEVFAWMGETFEGVGVSIREAGKATRVTVSHIRDVGKTTITATNRLSAMGGVITGVDRSVRAVSRSYERFKMHLLSVMFFGMHLQRTFGGMIQQTLKMTGILDLLSATVNMILLPAILPFMNILIELFTWFMNLPDRIKKFIASLVIAGAVIGALLFTIGTLGLALQGLTQFFRDLLPIDLLASLPGLGILFADLGENIEELITSWGALGILVGLFGMLTSAIDTMIGSAEGFEQVGGWLGEIADYGVGALNFLLSLKDTFTGVLLWILGNLGEFGQTFVSLLGRIFTGPSIVDWMRNLFTLMLEMLGSLADQLMTWLIGPFWTDDLKPALRIVMALAGALLQGRFADITALALDRIIPMIFNSIVNVVGAFMGWITGGGWDTTIGPGLDRLLSMISNLVSDFLDTATTPHGLFGQFLFSLGDLIEWFIREGWDIGSWAISLLTRVASELWKRLPGMISGILNWITEQVSSAVEKGLRRRGFGYLAAALPFYPLYMLQHGGVIPGPPTRAVPAILHGGEIVIPRNRLPTLTYSPVFNINISTSGSIDVDTLIEEIRRRDIDTLRRRLLR